MPRHWSPGVSHPGRDPPTLPRETEDFPRGDGHFKQCASAHIPNLLITNTDIYGRSILSFIAAPVCEESAPREIRNLFTIG